MKVAMHPLIVAVALGLVSPSTLDVVAEASDGRADNRDGLPTSSDLDGRQAAADDDDAAVDALLKQLLDQGDESLSVTADAEGAWSGLEASTTEAPTPEAIEAVELAWLEARRLV